MSRIIKKQIIKQGNIIQNYLVDFPQYIDKKSNCIYKLEINDGTNNTTLHFNVLNSISTKIDILGDDFYFIIDSNLPQKNPNIQLEKGYHSISILGQYSYIQSLNKLSSSLISIETIGNNISSLFETFKNCSNLSSIPNHPLTDSILNCQSSFQGCSKLQVIPYDFRLPRYCTNFNNMFLNSGIKEFQNNNFCLPPLTISCSAMFKNTKIESIPNGFFQYCTSVIQNIDNCFQGCSSLNNIDTFNPSDFLVLSTINCIFKDCYSIHNTNENFSINNNYISLKQLFENCTSLQAIGKLKLNYNILNLQKTFYNCSALVDDIKNIIVCNLNPNVNLNSSFFNCSTLYEYIPAWFLWKDYFHTNIHSNTFYNCNNISGYIPSDWE